MVSFVDLPTDIILLILAYFESEPIIQDDSIYNTPQSEWDGLPTLQACRRTCRALNELASSMICPVFRGSLNKQTMIRIDHLSRNPLIAGGIRAVELSLGFRPTSVATNAHQYFKFAEEKLDKYMGYCDYHTEFEDYEEDDQSEEAIGYRAHLAARDKFNSIEESWRQYLELGKPAGIPDVPADASYDRLFQDCFATYRRKQQEEEEIVNDGSFVSVVASAMSRFEHPRFLSFLDYTKDSGEWKATEVAEDDSLLREDLLRPHRWMEAERIEAELQPASILVELPIACDRLKAPLHGLHIGCFPLTRSFSSLLSASTHSISTWSSLSLACQSLKSVQIGRRGLNCTPARKERIPDSDCEIISAYMGAICSGVDLRILYLSMTPFRVCDSRINIDRRTPVADLYYQAGSILPQVKSTSLKEVHLHNVEISCSELQFFLAKLAHFKLQNIRLCSIHLSEGSFASSVEILRSRKSNSEGCNIDLSSFTGGGFGAPRGFDDGHFPFGEERAASFSARLEEHMYPALLKRVCAYIRGESEKNPLPSD